MTLREAAGAGRTVGELPGDALVEPENMGGAVAIDFRHELLRKCVDDRGADPVQTTRRRVGATAELAAGVKLGEHDLERGDLLSGVQIDRNASPVVGDLDRAITMQGDVDLVGETSRCLVDGIVDQLPDEVHETIGAGAADVHARTLANGLQPFEGLDGVGVVARGAGLLRRHQAERSNAV